MYDMTHMKLSINFVKIATVLYVTCMLHSQNVTTVTHNIVICMIVFIGTGFGYHDCI